MSPGGHGWPHVQTCPSHVSTTECVPPAATYMKDIDTTNKRQTHILNIVLPSESLKKNCCCYWNFFSNSKNILGHTFMKGNIWMRVRKLPGGQQAVEHIFEESQCPSSKVSLCHLSALAPLHTVHIHSHLHMYVFQIIQNFQYKESWCDSRLDILLKIPEPSIACYFISFYFFSICLWLILWYACTDIKSINLLASGI